MITDCFRVYKSNEKYLVLNPNIPSWIVTNINGVLVLKCYREDKSFSEIANDFCEKCHFMSPSEVIEFLNKAFKARLFQHPKPYNYVYGKLNSLYLNMTKLCNFSCSYCFATSRSESSDNNLSYKKYISIVDELYELNSGAVITFTGGEPLLSPLTIPVAQYAKKKGLTTFLLSNGSLVDLNNVDVIVDSFDNIKISMDGSTPELFERYRGKGNYNRVNNAIELLISKNANVTVSMVVTKENYHDVSNMVDKWNGRVNFMPLFPLGSALNNEKSNALSGKEYYDVLSNDARIEPFTGTVNYLSGKMRKPIMKCAIGDCELSISSTGDVYPCQLLHEPKFYLGSIMEFRLKDILEISKERGIGNHTVECMDKCQKCDIRYICGGACQARHFSETGSIDIVGDFCEYEKNGIINGIINNAIMVEV
ncbi:MAG: radical SAM protein [Phascolarctobacterium sp.]|nr:radical SAM protein [Phascolarctobacterium sp.]